MVKLYVRYILSMKMTIEDVPDLWKADVQAELDKKDV